MCFSATESFSAGVVLALVGGIAMSKARTIHERPLAAIPIIFSVQQITEGFLWLGLIGDNQSVWVRILTYVYLFFAQVLWPTWIPFAGLCLEIQPTRKRILLVLFALGTSLSFYLGSYLFIYGASAEIIGHHIHYTCDLHMKIAAITGIVYGISTIIPAFVSGVKNIWILGLTTAIAYILTEVFYENFTISVWCYFAAMLSILVVWILVSRRRPVLC